MALRGMECKLGTNTQFLNGKQGRGEALALKREVWWAPNLLPNYFVNNQSIPYGLVC